MPANRRWDLIRRLKVKPLSSIFISISHTNQNIQMNTPPTSVVGSIPSGVIMFFHWLDASGHVMALGSTRPVAEMSSRDISWG